MSRYAENLGRAARILKRLEDIGGVSDLEGTSLKEIIEDVLQAQNRAFVDEAIRHLETPSNVVAIDSYSRKVFACNPDESGGIA